MRVRPAHECDYCIISGKTRLPLFCPTVMMLPGHYFKHTLLKAKVATTVKVKKCECSSKSSRIASELLTKLDEERFLTLNGDLLIQPW